MPTAELPPARNVVTQRVRVNVCAGGACRVHLMASTPPPGDVATGMQRARESGQVNVAPDVDIVCAMPARQEPQADQTVPSSKPAPEEPHARASAQTDAQLSPHEHQQEPLWMTLTRLPSLSTVTSATTSTGEGTSAAPGAAVHPTVRLHRTHARQRAKHGGHNHPPSPTSTHATAGTIVDLQRMRNDIRHDEQKKQRLLQKLRSKNASLKALLQETSVEQLVSATLRDGHCKPATFMFLCSLGLLTG